MCLCVWWAGDSGQGFVICGLVYVCLHVLKMCHAQLVCVAKMSLTPNRRSALKHLSGQLALWHTEQNPSENEGHESTDVST